MRAESCSWSRIIKPGSLATLGLGVFALTCISTFAGESAAFAQASPTSIGGGSNRTKINTPGTKIQVEQRQDDVTKQSKKSLSQREKRQAKGGSFSRSEMESAQVERNLGGALDREITYVEKLLPTLSKKSEQRPEILRRLVESYHQKAVLVFFEENRRYDTAWAKWDKGGRRGTEPVLDIRASKAWTSRVIQKAQQFITEYPNHKRVDEAYFQIAFALDSMDQRNEAAGYYSQMVKKFPNSKRIPDAHFALGEFYFDKQDYPKALASYQEVARFTRSNIYPWAVYKIAWCYFNMQKYRESLSSFQSVVSISQNAAGLSAAGKLRLKDEALREMVAVYAELNDIGGAERYFAQVGGDKYYGDLLIRLAGLLRERGQFEESVGVLRKFVTRNPTSFKAAEIQIQIVDTAARLGDKKILWAEMRALLSGYRADTPWGQKNAQDPGFKDVVQRVHTVAITTPKLMHQDYQKTKNKNLAQEAEVGYGLYLTYFGSRPEATEVRFLLGELQYQNSRYSEAMKNFWGVAQLKEKTPHFAKAAEYVVSSAFLPIESDLKALRKKPAQQPGKGQPVALSQSFQDYVKACDQYVQWFPKDKRILDCQVDTAEVYLKHNQFAEAEKRLEAVAKTYPDRPEGKNSALLLLWLAESDEKKLIARADSLSKVPQYNQGDLGKRMGEIKRAARLKGIEAMVTSAPCKAAQEYERVGTENPAANEADKAWFNAGSNYRKCGEIEKSIAAYTKVYSAYPKSPLGADSIVNIVEMSEDRLDITRAADHSYVFLQKFPKDKRAPVISRETCFLYDALNNVRRAQELCGQVVASKRNPDATDAAKTLAELYFRNRRYTDFLQTLDTTIFKLPLNDGERMDYLAKSVEAERKLGRQSAVAKRMGDIEALYKRNPKGARGPGLTEIARVAFYRQMPSFDQYKGLRIEARKDDASDLIPTTQRKQKALEGVESAFKQVISVGDPEWAVASLYIAGYAFELFSADLRNPPRPPKATEEDMKVIRANFEKLAAAPQEKAKVYYSQALQVAGKESVMTDFTRKVMEALSRVSPKDYKKLDDWVPGSIFVGSSWMEIGQTRKAIDALGGAR